jgi:hypothetical protein
MSKYEEQRGRALCWITQPIDTTLLIKGEAAFSCSCEIEIKMLTKLTRDETMKQNQILKPAWTLYVL